MLAEMVKGTGALGFSKVLLMCKILPCCQALRSKEAQNMWQCMHQTAARLEDRCAWVWKELAQEESEICTIS